MKKKYRKKIVLHEINGMPYATTFLHIVPWQLRLDDIIIVNHHIVDISKIPEWCHHDITTTPPPDQWLFNLLTQNLRILLFRLVFISHCSLCDLIRELAYTFLYTILFLYFTKLSLCWSTNLFIFVVVFAFPGFKPWAAGDNGFQANKHCLIIIFIYRYTGT